MTVIALVVFIAALTQHAWVVASIAAVPIAGRIGYRTAVRKTGVSMVRTGARRIVTGRLS